MLLMRKALGRHLVVEGLDEFQKRLVRRLSKVANVDSSQNDFFRPLIRCGLSSRHRL